MVRADQVDLEVTGGGITASEVVGGKVSQASAPVALPDILGQLQNETDLTRVTLARILKRLDGDARVRFFVKLPSWFTIDTPVGPYNPDWAICWDDEDKPRLHLVRETKSTYEEIERRGVENAKIACAKEHFAAIGTGYGVATTFDDLIEQMG